MDGIPGGIPGAIPGAMPGAPIPGPAVIISGASAGEERREMRKEDK